MADALLQTIDEVVTSWPGAKAKQVFGHRGYVRGKKMFGFLDDAGVAVKVMSDADSAELYARPGVVPFMYSGMEMRAWAVLPIASSADVDEALDRLQRSYEAVAG